MAGERAGHGLAGIPAVPIAASIASLHSTPAAMMWAKTTSRGFGWDCLEGGGLMPDPG